MRSRMKSKEVTGWVRASHRHAFEEQYGFYAIVRSLILTQLRGLLGAGGLKIVSALWSEEEQVPLPLLSCSSPGAS